MSDLRRVLLLGPPGAGKGVLGAFLAERLGVPHISSGQLLRASVEQGDPHHVAEQVGRGQVVPDRVAFQVVTQALGDDGFILDGFPRNTRQAQELDAFLEASERRVQLLLEMVVPDELASARLSRLARMESRSDDNPDTVVARCWPTTPTGSAGSTPPATWTRCSSAPSAPSPRSLAAPDPDAALHEGQRETRSARRRGR
jgi:adenylate kinase